MRRLKFTMTEKSSKKDRRFTRSAENRIWRVVVRLALDTGLISVAQIPDFCRTKLQELATTPHARSGPQAG
jgi:hypothetical protein